MKKLLSDIPGIRQKALLIAILSLTILAFQTVNLFYGGITLLYTVYFLIALGINILLLYSLFDVLNPAHTARALGVIRVTYRVLFICMCILMGFVGLIYMLGLIIVITHAKEMAGTYLVASSIILILGSASFIYLKYCGYIAKTAKELKADEFSGSKKPETWAIIYAATFLVYILFRLILNFIVPPILEAQQGSGTEVYVKLASTLTDSSGNMLTNILYYLICLLQCAMHYAVYLLLKTLRENIPASEKNDTGKRKLTKQART